MPAQREVGLHPVLQRSSAQLGEANDLSLRKEFETEVGQWLTAPQRRRPSQDLGGPLGVGRHLVAAGADQPLKSHRIDRLRRDRQLVAVAAGAQHAILGSRDPTGLQRPSQARHVGLQRVHGGSRWFRCPQHLDQPVGRDQLVGVHHQRGQQEPLLGTGDLDAAVLRLHFQRTENGEVQRCRRTVDLVILQ